MVATGDAELFSVTGASAIGAELVPTSPVAVPVNVTFCAPLVTDARDGVTVRLVDSLLNAKSRFPFV